VPEADVSAQSINISCLAAAPPLEDQDMSNAMAVTDATFAAEVEAHDGFAVVDVGAAWCPPCRIIEPIVDALAVEYAGRAKVVTLDADTNVQTTARYGVRGLPTLLFFKNGKVVDQVIGALPRAALAAKFAQHAA
jgi:thioredoxin